MKKSPIRPKYIFQLFFIFSLLSSCSKDTDLFSDYMADSKNSIDLGLLAVNDNFYSAGNSSIILDVLANDNIENTVDVEILETSNPINGIVIINDNKTLTYIPANKTEATTPTTTTPTTNTDTTPPIITSISDSTTDTAIVVDWYLNEGSSGRIEWGTDASFGNFTSFESNYLTHHHQTISGLANGTEYTYRILSVDAAGNGVIGANRTAKTTTPTTTTPTTTTTTTDTFTYTTQVTDNTGNTTTQQAIVTINSSIATSGDNVYYVTTSGSSSNNGTSESSSWSIQHAFNTAEAGDIVYIKAGLYSDYNITQKNNGSSVNPIHFIGYKSSPGDIDSEAQTTLTLGTQTINTMSNFKYGDTVNSSNMPLMQESNTSSTALTINGSFIFLQNIQVKNYGTAVRNSGNSNTFKNIIAIDAGDQSSSAYSGNSIYNYGNYSTWKNIYTENSGAQNFTIQGNHGNYDGISSICDNSVNPTDYYFLFQEGSSNTATNIYVRRVGNLKHYGHGIVYKSAEECYNNNVTSFIIDNTALELQFPGVHDNIVKNGYIIKQSNTTSSNAGGLTLANGSYENTLDNIFIENANIQFQDWNDGAAGDVDNDASDRNIFNQVTVLGGDFGVSFHYNGNNLYSSSADNNTFYNCTFYNAETQFENSRTNTNTKFVNCIWGNIDNYSEKRSTSPGYDLDVEYSNNNFYGNGFSAPSGTNITMENPLFNDVSNGDLSLQSNSPLKGKGIATPFLSAGNDLGSFQ